MRVTQSMLSNNMLRNLSSSYTKMGKLQDQLASQKKITRPSDDPVVAMLGLGYRTDLNQVQQYSRNITEVNNWLDSTDDAISQGVKVLQRVRELTVQASNGTYEDSQRSAIAVEVNQMKEQLQTIAETQVGGKYIFNGTNTNKAPKNGQFSDGDINIEIFDGITMTVNTQGKELFGPALSDADNPETAAEEGILSGLVKILEDPNASDEQIQDYITKN
jgi:flagellar hook-associated protein 3 FlgL